MNKKSLSKEYAITCFKNLLNPQKFNYIFAFIILLKKNNFDSLT